jgi:threonine synthase
MGRPARTDPGIFTYASSLPPCATPITLGEGSTPLVSLDRLADHLGVRALYGKLESCNPTGSYKDRVAAMSMSLAVSRRQRGWVATSSGNAGVALATYGRRAGLPGFLCVVPSIPREKLLPILALGVPVVRVEGLGTGARGRSERGMFEVVQAAADGLDLFLAVTAHRFNHDGMRGADTIAYELVDAGLDDGVAYVPTGGGGLVSAICRGVRQRGARLRVVAAQPSGCAPIARFLAGEIDCPEIEACTSRVSALQLPAPPDGELAAQQVAATAGWGTHAGDDAIQDAQRLLANLEGVFVEPAAATSLAGAIADLAAGRLDPATTATLVLTGGGGKDLASVEPLVEAPPTVAVDRLADEISTWVGSTDVRAGQR